MKVTNHSEHLCYCSMLKFLMTDQERLQKPLKFQLEIFSCSTPEAVTVVCGKKKKCWVRACFYRMDDIQILMVSLTAPGYESPLLTVLRRCRQIELP